MERRGFLKGLAFLSTIPVAVGLRRIPTVVAQSPPKSDVSAPPSRKGKSKAAEAYRCKFVQVDRSCEPVPQRGDFAFWSDEKAQVVTTVPDKPSTRPAGVFINPIAAGSCGFIQTSGWAYYGRTNLRVNLDVF